MRAAGPPAAAPGCPCATAFPQAAPGAGCDNTPASRISRALPRSDPCRRAGGARRLHPAKGGGGT